MSDGNRDSIASYIGAALIVIGLTALGPISATLDQQKRQHAEASYQAAIEEQRAVAVLVLDPRKQAVATEERERRREQREADDLEVQRAAADWTFVQALFGILGFGGLVVTAFYAHRTWKTAERALYGIERPIILVDVFPNDRPLPAGADSARGVFRVEVRNVGESLANVVMVSGRFLVVPPESGVPKASALGPFEESCLCILIEERRLIPKEKADEIFVQRGMPLTELQATEVRERRAIGYFIANVVYVDTLEQLRQTLAVFVFDPPTSSYAYGRFLQIMNGDHLLKGRGLTEAKEAQRTMLSAQIPILWGALKREAEKE